jgi:hypothetical protein
VVGARRHSGGSTTRGSQGGADQPGRAQRDASLRGALSGGVHAVRQVWVGPCCSRWGMSTSAGVTLRIRCITEMRCEGGLLQRGAYFRDGGRGPGTSSWDSKLPRRRSGGPPRSPRLTWRIGCEQVLPRRRYRKMPHKVPSRDSSCGWSCQQCTHLASRKYYEVRPHMCPPTDTVLATRGTAGEHSSMHCGYLPSV